MMLQKNIQLGKQGVTDSFIENLKIYFKRVQIIRISVLKSAGHDKVKVKKYSEMILEKLGKNYKSRIVGFTIVVMKFKKVVR